MEIIIHLYRIMDNKILNIFIYSNFCIFYHFINYNIIIYTGITLSNLLFYYYYYYYYYNYIINNNIVNNKN